MVRNAVESQVITPPTFGEIVLRVINHVICAYRSAISTFLVLHTPVTSAPNDLAICTANVPTPPAAPLIKTFCPGWICSLSRSPCNAVNAATGAEAACSNVTLGALRPTLTQEQTHTRQRLPGRPRLRHSKLAHHGYTRRTPLGSIRLRR